MKRMKKHKKDIVVAIIDHLKIESLSEISIQEVKKKLPKN